MLIAISMVAALVPASLLSAFAEADPGLRGDGFESELDSGAAVPEDSVVLVPELVENPVPGVAYKFYIEQNNLGKTLYLTGEMNGYYYAASEDVSEAVDLYVEEVEGGIRVYFLNDGIKTYLEIVKSGAYINVVFVTDPTMVFTYNEDLDALNADVGGTTYYIGTYNNYSTFSASKTSYIDGDNANTIGVRNFIAHFGVLVEAPEVEPEDPEDPEDPEVEPEDPEEENGITYEFDADTGTLTISGRGTMDNYADESLAPWYNYRKEITNIVIQNGVTSIGEWAFFYCTSLTSIDIPDSVTSIGYSAFSGCTSLESIEIPDSVMTIGKGAFYDCSSLTSIVIPEGITSIDDYAFFGCSSLTSISYSGTCDEWLAFKEAGVLDDNTGNYTVYCTDGTVSKHGTVIRNKGNCGDSLTYEFDADTGTLTISGAGEMWDYNEGFAPWHDYRDSITAVVLQSGITAVGDFAFVFCTSLESVDLPDSVTVIGDSAFSWCGKLSEIQMSGVTSVGENAFWSCSSLTAVSLPNAVTINYYAFYDCCSLAGIYLPSVVEICDCAFYGCSALVGIDLPDSVTYIGAGAFESCTSLSSFVIPEGITEINSTVFSICASLESIVIPEGITTIDYSAFYGCASLVSVEIPASVTVIFDYAFERCNALKDISYDGSCEEWLAVEKGDDWDLDSDNYTVYCTDGTVSADGTVTLDNPVPKGDVNGDGNVNATDYLMLKRAVLGTFALSDQKKAAADINGDGNVNATDYLMLKRVVLGTYNLG